jgi:hypothetical protein
MICAPTESPRFADEESSLGASFRRGKELIYFSIEQFAPAPTSVIYSASD